jgi:hypothetical protein
MLVISRSLSLTLFSVWTMEQWATNYGMQKAQGVELYTSDGADYQLIANAPIAAGSSVLYVPSGQCDFIAPRR